MAALVFPLPLGFLRLAVSCSSVRSRLSSITFRRIRMTCSLTDWRAASLGRDDTFAASRSNSDALSMSSAALLKSSIGAVILSFRPVSPHKSPLQMVFAHSICGIGATVNDNVNAGREKLGSEKALGQILETVAALETEGSHRAG